LPNASRERQRDEHRDNVDAAAKRRGIGRTVRGRRTYDALLNAARVVFVREGFLHTRITDICDEAGLSHGTFYNYFTAKEEIFQDVLDSVELDLLTLDGAPEDANAIDRIRAANRHYLEAVRDNAGIIGVIQEVVTFDPEARATRARREDEFADALERRVRQYQADGIADGRLDPRIAGLALGGMVDAFANYLYVNGGGEQFDLDVVAEQLTLLWVNALGIPTGEPSS
jgi:AcrR family transcriptional regulator